MLNKRAANFNGFRPVALTSVRMKVLEMIVVCYVKSLLLKEMRIHPYKFAYREDRSTDDAVAITIYRVLSYLEPPPSKSINANAYCRILFVDYSSAFNSFVLEKLYSKLINLNANQEPLCRYWTSSSTASA